MKLRNVMPFVENHRNTVCQYMYLSGNLSVYVYLSFSKSLCNFSPKLPSIPCLSLPPFLMKKGFQAKKLMWYKVVVGWEVYTAPLRLLHLHLLLLLVLVFFVFFLKNLETIPN